MFFVSVNYLFQVTEQTEYEQSANLRISLANGNVMKIPLTKINITEEVNKTGIWKQVNDLNSTNEKTKEPKIIKYAE